MTLVNDKPKNHLQCVQSSQPYQRDMAEDFFFVSEDVKARRTTGRSLLLPVVSAAFYMQNTAYKGTIR